MPLVVGYISPQSIEFQNENKHCTTDDNMPIDAKEYRKRLRKAVSELKVGHSIYTDVSRFVVSANAMYYAKKAGFSISYGKQEGGIRLWRVDAD